MFLQAYKCRVLEPVPEPQISQSGTESADNRVYSWTPAENQCMQKANKIRDSRGF